MKYLEISDGMSVRIDSIDAVEAKDEFTSVIYFNGGHRKANFPYSTLISIISKDEVKEVETVKLEPQVMNALNASGHHFAG